MARITRVLLPLSIVAGGVGIAGFLVANAPKAEPAEVEVTPKLVEVMLAEPGRYQVTVPAMGIVRAEREVTLQPEISGLVVQQSEHLVDGGLVQAGDPLVRIDSRDIATQLELTRTELAQARLAVREETVQRQVAEAEWKDAPKDFSPDSWQYVMREPHLDAAKARVDSVRTRIKKAERDLSKAVLRAPFDAVVMSEAIDIGQLVGPQTPIARLAGVDRFWVQVAVPVSHLRMLRVPGIDATPDNGSTARIVATSGEDEPPRPGRVLRVLPAVEERGRMAQVLVGIEDPLGLALPEHERPTPLFLGTYVHVEIEGKALENVIDIPRKALRDDGRVFVVDGEGRLRTREIEVAWRDRGHVLVSSGVEAGEQIVVTPLPMATDGMKVQIVQPEKAG